ncbi:MAG TPA: 7-cyano-7-deazaguanine synthase, partial [Candidatus Polarisedimenticolia bacterium]|nr:7-cyano-7-deazaguanine synthase [Candidatus Polarisedimenticolia bacterium]
SWRHRVRRPRGVVVLSSGGLDSCALLAHEAAARSQVFPLFVSCGLIWEKAELAALRRFLAALPAGIARRVRPLRIAELPLGDLYGRHWSTTGDGVPGWRAADNSVYLPGRNIVLLTVAAIHAAMLGAPRIAIGPLRGNPFPDASPGFFSRMGSALSTGLDFPIRIDAPFQRLDKEDLIRRFAAVPLALSLSCSRPRGERACGACAKCRERVLAESSAAVSAEKPRRPRPGAARGGRRGVTAGSRAGRK